MKRFLLLLFICAGLNGFAQDSLLLQARNEVALDAAPLLSALFGHESWQLASSYKRSFAKHPRVWMRAGFRIVSPRNTATQVNSPYYYDVVTSDTTAVRHFERYRSRAKYELHAGVEVRTKERSGWSGFVSLDVFGNVSKRSWTTRFADVTYTSGGVYQSYQSTQPEEYRERKTWRLGFCSRAGGRYVFNAHWAMALHAGLEFDMIDKYLDSRGPATYWDFDPYIDGATGQLDVIYRF